MHQHVHQLCERLPQQAQPQRRHGVRRRKPTRKPTRKATGSLRRRRWASCGRTREVACAGTSTTGKKTPGGAGTHSGHKAHTRTHGGHRRTSQPSKPNDTPARPRDSRNRGRGLNSRKNSRRPGADHSPRPTQKRPPPANPTLPPPAPRAPPRACSKAVGGTDTIPVKRHRGEPGHTYGTHGRIQAHPTPNGQDTLLFAISMSPMRSARDSTHERRRTNTQTLKRSKTQLPLARRREAPSLGISSNISKFRYHADHPSFIHSSWPTSTLSG